MPKIKELKEPKAPAEAEPEALHAQREARADGFKALGDPLRLAICDYLAACAPQEQTAGAVCRAVTGDKKINAKVSHHLKELRRAGLIAMHKKGKNVLCALDTNGSAAALCVYLGAWADTNTLTMPFAQGEETDDDTNKSDKPDDAPPAHAA